jgi:phage-related protein (TIGR01555 family)
MNNFLASAFAQLAARVDGALTNALSGLGTSMDKSTGTTVQAVNLMNYQELEALYEGNDIMRHIAEDLPEDCCRRWCQLMVSAADVGAEVDPFKERFDALRVRERMQHAHVWSRVYGGAGIVMGLDDGRNAWEPLDEARLKGIKFLRVATADELRVESYVSEVTSPDIGRPEMYYFTPSDTAAGATRLHHTRLLRFEGRLATPRRRTDLDGWGMSRLQTAFEAVQRFEMAERGIAHTVHEYSQGVLKVKGLAAAVSGSNRNAFIQRMADLNLSKSMTRMLIVDQDGESYERQTISMTGLADAHDRFARSVCGAADMPATRLFGDAPGGLSTDNEAGRGNWNARIEAAQTHIYEPAILRLAQLMRIAGEVSLPQDATVAVKWRPLSDTDPKMEAETEKLQAEADQIYWTIQALDETEIRQSRFGGTTGSIRLMDRQQREQAAAETGDIGGAAPAPTDGAA